MTNKLTDLARGKECQIRIPGYCQGDTDTTVAAHYRLADTCGMGIKPNDLLVAWACFTCHGVVDGRYKSVYTHEQLRLMHAEGVLRTMLIIHEGNDNDIKHS